MMAQIDAFDRNSVSASIFCSASIWGATLIRCTTQWESIKLKS
jgi:hypothetical protein